MSLDILSDAQKCTFIYKYLLVMRKLLSMNKKSNQIDLVKLLFYILKRLWLVVLCAEIGFGVCYTYLTQELPDTFTAYGTMYVSSNSPDMYDAQSTYSGDLTSASQLIKTLLVVVKRDTVMAKVTDSISADHPEVTAAFVSESLSMESVSDTGVVAVKSTTEEAQLSADIVNAVIIGLLMGLLLKSDHIEFYINKIIKIK